MASRGRVIALLGAESTGKTSLATGLSQALRADGRRVAQVGEVLREFCDLRQRTPMRSEQTGIAQEQTRRIEAAAQSHELVIADTTALMIAVYSEQVFGDVSLYAAALAAHRRAVGMALLTALDLPWQADGFQRDGPAVREPVDAKVRAALSGAGLRYSLVSGLGARRLDTAVHAVRHALQKPSSPPEDGPVKPVWTWRCERCGDAHGERCSLWPKAMGGAPSTADRRT